MTSLHAVAARFAAARVPFALGGSGLLAALGLDVGVRDWDLTTEAPRPVVEALVVDFPHAFVPPNGIFATEYLYKVDVDGTSLDVMGTFALHHSEGVFVVPTVATGVWRGVPLGSPEVWAVVYTLMGREAKAALLFDYLAERGADAAMLSQLRHTPLPRELAMRIAEL